MKTLLPFIVAGLVSGSIYGLAALGLVITYKTSGVFNFAHGAVAAGSAYAFWELHFNHHLPWPLAAIAVVAGVGFVGGFVLEVLARRLANVDLTLRVVATIGLLVGIQALLIARYGAAARFVDTFLPRRLLLIGGVRIAVGQIIIFVLVLVAAGGLAVFFRATRLGMAIRGVVDDPALLALTRTDPIRIRRWGWAIGSSFAAASGILLAPSLGLDPIALTLLAIQAFGAAAVGAFTSLPLAYAGGLIVGVGSSVIAKFVATSPVLGGLPPSFPFIVLFVTLLVLPKKLLRDEPARSRPRPVRRTAAKPQGRKLGYTGLVALLLLVPLFAGTRQAVYTSAVIYAIIFLSLNLLVRTSGQVSIAHAAFAAVGASTFAQLSHGAGVPWLVSLILAGLVTVPIGALVAIPSIRLSGVYLAVATFGFGVLLQKIFFLTSLMFGHVGLREATRPHLPGLRLESDTGFYYVAVVIALVAVAATIAIERSRLGRLLRGLAGSPVALETYGTSINVTRVLIFCISAFMAGVAGAMLASLARHINIYSFDSFQSLLWLAVLVLAGTGTISSSFIAGGLLVVLPSYISNATVQSYLPVLFGVSAIAIAVLAGRDSTLGIRAVGSRISRSPVRWRAERATAPLPVLEGRS